MVGDAAVDAATDLRISARADAAIGKRARAHSANRGDAEALESLRGPDRFHRHRGPGGRGEDYADAGRRLSTSALYRSRSHDEVLPGRPAEGDSRRPAVGARRSDHHAKGQLSRDSRRRFYARVGTGLFESEVLREVSLRSRG